MISRGACIYTHNSCCSSTFPPSLPSRQKSFVHCLATTPMIVPPPSSCCRTHCCHSKWRTRSFRRYVCSVNVCKCMCCKGMHIYVGVCICIHYSRFCCGHYSRPTPLAIATSSMSYSPKKEPVSQNSPTSWTPRTPREPLRRRYKCRI